MIILDPIGRDNTSLRALLNLSHCLQKEALMYNARGRKTHDLVAVAGRCIVDEMRDSSLATTVSAAIPFRRISTYPLDKSFYLYVFSEGHALSQKEEHEDSYICFPDFPCLRRF